MTKVSLFIEGVPKPKGRPRFRVHGGRVMTYTPKETAVYEEFIAEYIRTQFPGREVYEGPVTLEIEFLMPIPKSVLNKFRYHRSDCKNVPVGAVPGPTVALPSQLYVACPLCKPGDVAWYVPKLPVARPDLDNLEKAVSDGIQKSEVIKDDSQVVTKVTRKRYSRTPGVKIDITFGGEM